MVHAPVSQDTYTAELSYVREQIERLIERRNTVGLRADERERYDALLDRETALLGSMRAACPPQTTAS